MNAKLTSPSIQLSTCTCAWLFLHLSRGLQDTVLDWEEE